MPRQSLEVCVVDGDAPPERFDHARTLLYEQVPRDTHPDFLRKRGLDRSRNRGQITPLVRHRSARLPSPLDDSASELSVLEATIRAWMAIFFRHPQIPSESGDGTGLQVCSLVAHPPRVERLRNRMSNESVLERVKRMKDEALRREGWL